MNYLDEASQTEQFFADVALKNTLAKAQPTETPLIFNGHRYCVSCDSEIDRKRIMAYPAAVRCIACQEVRESQNKHKR